MQRNTKTRKFTGLAGFLLSSEVCLNAVTFALFRSNIYSNSIAVKKVTAYLTGFERWQKILKMLLFAT